MSNTTITNCKQVQIQIEKASDRYKPSRTSLAASSVLSLAVHAVNTLAFLTPLGKCQWFDLTQLSPKTKVRGFLFFGAVNLIALLYKFIKHDRGNRLAFVIALSDFSKTRLGPNEYMTISLDTITYNFDSEGYYKGPYDPKGKTLVPYQNLLLRP